KNFPDLGGASLNVAAEGVVLSNIGNAGVNTNASLKISGSSLSSLNITSIDMGRGSAAKTRPPRVELLSSDLSSDITVALENAYLTVNDITADRIALNADNAQLTIEDNTSVINNILTDKECKVVLEDGTSDTIPCSTDKITVTGSGKLTQVNMQAAESLILTKLSPESGLITTMKEGESIDFSSLEVIGTYMASGAVTVYTAKLTYDLQTTFTKLERDFTVKIDGLTAYQRDNGEASETGYNWQSLTPGYHQGVISCDFGDTAADYTYNFEVTVYEDSLEPELIGIEVDYSGVTIEYLASQTLDLSGLKVKGLYQVESIFAGTTTYKEEITDYALSVASGTELTEEMTSDIVSYNGKTAVIPLTVYPSCRVILHYGYKTEVRMIKQYATIIEPEVSRPGYTQGTYKISYNNYADYAVWHTVEDPANNDNAFDFTTQFDKDTDLYAHWVKTKPSIGSIVYRDFTTADETNDRYIFVTDPLYGRDPIGIVAKFGSSSQIGMSGIMVYLDETRAAWCSADYEKWYETEFSTIDDDGSGNLNVLKNYLRDAFNIDKFPAFKYCDELVSDDPNNKWYLPAIDEIKRVISFKQDINNALDKLSVYAVAVTKIDNNNNIDSSYWSSSDYGKYTLLRGEYCAKSYKTREIIIARNSINQVRPIRKFKCQDSTVHGNVYTYQ
ncbi:MAG: hypothetical protein IKP67_06125, partial [Spirochaetales bacterium]|nr:hypothetical protein [Spirochaetales bacterium]